MTRVEIAVKVRYYQHGADLAPPAYQTPGSAGMDLRAAIETRITIPPLERRLIPIGISLEIPQGYEAQIRPRSGLALRKGLSILNSPGTIDSDYRGEIRVIVINLGNEQVSIERGDRIAQLVISPVIQAEIQAETQIVSGENEPTSPGIRGARGFGSTGSS